MAVVDDAGAEPDDASPGVVDGKGDPIAEPVVGAAVVAFDEQPGPEECRAHGLAGAQRIEHPAPSGGREADLEFRSDRSRQAAALEIPHRPRCLRVVAKLLHEVPVGALEGVEERLEIVARNPSAAAFAGYFAPGSACELLHRLDELQVRVVHQEADRGPCAPQPKQW